MNDTRLSFIRFNGLADGRSVRHHADRASPSRRGRGRTHCLVGRKMAEDRRAGPATAAFTVRRKMSWLTFIEPPTCNTKFTSILMTNFVSNFPRAFNCLLFIFYSLRRWDFCTPCRPGHRWFCFRFYSGSQNRAAKRSLALPWGANPRVCVHSPVGTPTATQGALNAPVTQQTRVPCMLIRRPPFYCFSGTSPGARKLISISY